MGSARRGSNPLGVDGGGPALPEPPPIKKKKKKVLFLRAHHCPNCLRRDSGFASPSDLAMLCWSGEAATLGMHLNMQSCKCIRGCISDALRKRIIGRL